MCLGAGFLFGNVPIVKDNFSLVTIGIVFVSVLPMVFELVRADGAADPAAVGLARFRRQHHEFGQLVGMQCAKPRLEVLQPCPRRLDDERPLRLALDGILPTIRRRNRRLHVDARRQAFVHERSRQRVGALVVGHRRQNNDEVGHLLRFPACICNKLVYCFPRVPKVDRSPRKRQTPKAKRPVRSRRMVSILLLVVAGAIIVDGLVGEKGLLAMLRARHQYDAAVGDHRAQAGRQRAPAREARRLKDDPSAIEEVARRELGLIKPGEKVFIVKDVPPAKP